MKFCSFCVHIMPMPYPDAHFTAVALYFTTACSAEQSHKRMPRSVICGSDRRIESTINICRPAIRPFRR